MSLASDTSTALKTINEQGVPEANQLDKLIEQIQSARQIEGTISNKRKELDQQLMAAQAEAVQNGIPVMPAFDPKTGQTVLTHTPPDMIAAYQTVQVNRAKAKAGAETLGQLAAIDEYNKSLAGLDGGADGELPSPDDPRLVKAYVGPSGKLATVTLGEAKSDAVNEAAKVYPALKRYQNVSPIVQSYLTNEPTFETGTVRQASLIEALKALRISKLDPTDIAGQQSVTSGMNALMNKVTNGGGLGKDVERDLRRQLVSEYNALGEQYNGARGSVPKYAKVKIGSIDELLPAHKPVVGGSSGKSDIPDGTEGTWNGKPVVRKGGKWQLKTK